MRSVERCVLSDTPTPSSRRLRRRAADVSSRLPRAHATRPRRASFLSSLPRARRTAPRPPSRAEIRVGETDRARRASGARAPVSGRGHARAATTHRTNAKRRRRAAPRSPDHPPRPRSRPDRDPSSSCLHRFDDEKKQKNTFFPRRRFKRRAAKTTYDSNKPARGDG